MAFSRRSTALLLLALAAPAGARLLRADPTLATAQKRPAAAAPVQPAASASANATGAHSAAGGAVGARAAAEAAPKGHATGTKLAANASSTKLAANASGAKLAANASGAKPARRANLSAEAQVRGLKAGLEAIRKLRAHLAAPGSAPAGRAGDLQRLAQGAMTTELQRPDSLVWATIDSMLGETTKAMAAMKTTGKADQEKLVGALEDALNSKAVALKNVTQRVTKEQERQSAEYLLGLLMQHQGAWPLDKQLNVTREFAAECPVARELLQHHSASGDLAPQLAALMDAGSSGRAAARLLLQLAELHRRA